LIPVAPSAHIASIEVPRAKTGSRTDWQRSAALRVDHHRRNDVNQPFACRRVP
jgi:hypothetical protein